MSQVLIYTELKTLLLANGIKHVDIWRNQFSNEDKENAFLFPCAFIEFTNDNFVNLPTGIQLFDCFVTIHLGFESYKDTDLDVLTLEQTIHSAVHGYQVDSTISKLLRTGIDHASDYDNYQDLQIQFKTTIKDFQADSRGTIDVTLTPGINVSYTALGTPVDPTAPSSPSINSKITIYNNLKTLLLANGIKHVDIWRSQFDNENKENAFLCPCCFIQYETSDFLNLPHGIQMYNCFITLHLGFESMKDTDLDVLTLKQTIHSLVNGFQPSTTTSKLLRIEEYQEDNFNNIQDYKIKFKSTIKDFSADNRPTIDATLSPLIVANFGIGYLLAENEDYILLENEDLILI